MMAESPEWLDRLRRTAADRFDAMGFPTSRDEEWRFTPISPITKAAWKEATAPARISLEELKPYLFGHPEWTRVVFVNGLHQPELSSISDGSEGLRVGSLADALRDGTIDDRHFGQLAPVESNPFSTLNTGRFRDGGLVQVPAGSDLQDPIHLVFLATEEAEHCAIHPRSLILVGRGARASVIESYVPVGSVGGYWTNAVTEVVAGASSWVEHTRIQRESERAYHIGGTFVAQARDSHYRSFSLAMGGALARHNLQARLNDENVETLLYGLYLTRGGQLVDNHTAICHDQPNCRSWEVYKGILDDHSRAVFNGKVFVRPEAQKTDAKQTNRNLLLSDAAKVDTKPQLEIFADDVKCTHGATVGKLNEQQRFYLRTRGIAGRAAEIMLMTAFVAEVLEEITHPQIRHVIDALVRAEMDALIG